MHQIKSLQIMGSYKVIGKNGKELESDVLLHPGIVLGDELLARNIPQKDTTSL